MTPWKRILWISLGFLVGILLVTALLGTAMFFQWFGQPLVAQTAAWTIGGLLAVWLITLLVVTLVYRAQNKPQEMRNREQRTRDIAAFAQRLETASRRIHRRNVIVPRYLFLGVAGAQNQALLQSMAFVRDAQPGGTADPESNPMESTGLEIWVNQSSVLLFVKLGHMSSTDMTLIMQALKRARPRRPLNAALLGVELSALLPSPARDQSLWHGDMARELLNQANTHTGTRLPTYVLMSELDRLAGVSTLHALAPGARAQSPFGVLLTQNNQGSGGKDQSQDQDRSPNNVNQGIEGAIAQAFADLYRGATQYQLDTVSAIHDGISVANVLSAPLQLSVIEQITARFCSQLSTPLPPQRQGLDIQGLFFCRTGQTSTQLSPVADMIEANHADILGKVYARHPAQPLEVPQPQLFNQVLFPEAQSAPFNTVGNSRYWALAWVAIISISITVGWLGYGLWQNISRYEAQNQRTLVAFQNYLKPPIVAESQDISATLQTKVTQRDDIDYALTENIEPNVRALNVLETQIDRYDALDSRFWGSYMVKPSLEGYYRDQFEQQLLGNFRTALATFIEDELDAQSDLVAFMVKSRNAAASLVDASTNQANQNSPAAQKLADEDSRLQENLSLLLSRYLQQDYFFRAPRANSDELVTFFTAELKDRGAISPKFEDMFRGYLARLFALDLPPRPRGVAQREAQALMFEQTLAKTLYLAVVQTPHFATLVNVRNDLGSDFSDVFENSGNASDYSIPYAFTKEGFMELFENNQEQFLPYSNADYRSLLGDNYTTVEVANIQRAMQRLYIDDYNAQWQSLTDALTLVTLEDWEQSQSVLKKLVQGDRPLLTRVYQYLYNNTALDTEISTAIGAQGASPAATADGNPDASNQPASTAAMTVANDEITLGQSLNLGDMGFDVAQAVEANFPIYVDALASTDAGGNWISEYAARLRTVSDWMAEANLRGDRGLWLFDALTLDPVDTSLLELNRIVQNRSMGIVSEIASQVAWDVNQMAMVEVMDYVNRRWRRQIVAPLTPTILERFPFDPLATEDVSYADFKTAFAPQGGAISSFFDTYVQPLTLALGDEDDIRSFLPSNTQKLDNQLYDAISTAREIGNAFFNGEDLNLVLQVQVNEMSASIADFRIISDLTLYRYRHGRRELVDIAIPASGTRTNYLGFEMVDRNGGKAQLPFEGPWAWFRAAQSFDTRIQEDNSEVVFVVPSGIGSAQLLVKTKSLRNPFENGYFDAFALPNQILLDSQKYELLQAEAAIDSDANSPPMLRVGIGQ